MINGRAQTVGSQVSRMRRKCNTFYELALLLAFLFPLLLLNGCAGFVSGAGKQTTPQAAFQLSPASISFGSVSIGKVSKQSISVSNIGSTALNITGMKLSSAQFSISGMTTPMALAVGQSASFLVSVNPTAAGPLTGTLTAQGDSGSPSVVVNLTATAMGVQPQLSLNTAGIEFGTVSDGLKATSNLSLSNLGASDLTISMISISGAEFSLGGITTPKVIASGQTIQASVTFSPTAAGIAGGNIGITSNDPANPTANVPLTGTGTSTASGQLSASPASVSFGTVATGGSASLNVVLTNTGNAAVKISGVTAQGTGFTVGGVTAPATLNPAQSATLSASFAPKGTGSSSGSILILSDAANSTLSIALSGTGAQAGLAISPASFDFASVADGQTKSQTFTLTNTGTAALTISQLSATASAFSVSGLVTPKTINAGGTATFSVLFAPTTAGGLSGSVTITSNAPNSPNALPLSGTGSAATVTLASSPASLTFTGVNAGSSSSKNVTITNTGNTSLTVSKITVNAKDFGYSGISTPLTLNAGQNASMTVSFGPQASEQISGNITVTSTQGVSAVIPVTGGAVQAGLTITPSSASFGNVTVGSPSTQTIQLSNSGTAVVTVTQVSVTGSGFHTGTLALPISLNPSQSTTFNLQFAPASAGAASGSASIVSNAPNSPAAMALSGTGILATELLSFSTTSASFGNVNTGSSSTQNIVVTNTGNANVLISQIKESGAEFSLSGAGTPVTISPGQNLTFGVIFAPTAAGSASGTVTVTSNATSSPTTIVLSGAGLTAAPHSVALNWNASTSTVSGYNVYRSTTSGTGYAKINPSLVSGLTYADTTPVNGTTYYYVTTAVDSSGNESTYSNEAAAAVP